MDVSASPSLVLNDAVGATELLLDHLNNSDMDVGRDCLNGLCFGLDFLNRSLTEAPKLNDRLMAKSVILGAMALAAIVGNVTTLVSISKSHRVAKKPLYILLKQLVISDLLVSIWCLCGEAAWTYTVQWLGCQTLCKLFKFSQVCSLYLSTYIMVLIGLDRLRAVRQPIRHVVSPKGFKPILAAWILSVIFASPQLVIFSVKSGPFDEPFHQCVTHGYYTHEWEEQLYIIFSLVTMVVIPFLILIISYTCIFITIANKESQSHSKEPIFLPQVNLNGRINFLRRAKFKSLSISLVIVITFFICWAPYIIVMIGSVFCFSPDDHLSEELQETIFFFGMSNSLINPIIYGSFHLAQKPKQHPSVKNGFRDMGKSYTRGHAGELASWSLRHMSSLAHPIVSSAVFSTSKEIKANPTNQFDQLVIFEGEMNTLGTVTHLSVHVRSPVA